jgi:outer membrane protein assembly factor BamB
VETTDWDHRALIASTISAITLPMPYWLASCPSMMINARLPQIMPGQVVGYYIAMDPLTGQRKWQVPLTDVPSSAGMLVTGGGLVFTGKLTGEFLALDEDTGQTLWQFQTSSSVNSTAITYVHKGRQYVTVAWAEALRAVPSAARCLQGARYGRSR